MSTEVVSPLRQRMIEDMTARKLGAHSQRSRIYSCKLTRGKKIIASPRGESFPVDVARLEAGIDLCFLNLATNFRRFSKTSVDTASSAKRTLTLHCARFAWRCLKRMLIFRSPENLLLA